MSGSCLLLLELRRRQLLCQAGKGALGCLPLRTLCLPCLLCRLPLLVLCLQSRSSGRLAGHCLLLKLLLAFMCCVLRLRQRLTRLLCSHPHGQGFVLQPLYLPDSVSRQ